MLNDDDITTIISLANLEVADDERAKLATDLNSILEYVGKLEAIDVTDVEPMSHVHGIKNIVRDDQVEKSMTPEDTFRNAPDRVSSFFRVPIVLDQN